MKKNKINSQAGEDFRVNPVIAAVAGALVGAGIAVAGVALSDEKNRKKVIKIASDMKDNLATYVEKKQNQAEIKKEELGEKISTGKENVSKVVKSAKKSLHKTTKEVNNALKSI